MATPSVRSSGLLNEVNSQWRESTIDDATISAKLAQLKVIARDPRAAPDVYSESGLKQIYNYAFEKSTQPRSQSSIEAARIVANALLLQDSLRPVLAEDKFLVKILQFYSLGDHDHEFVGARILFLLTYTQAADFDFLVEKHDLLRQIQLYLSKHAERLLTKADTQMATMALTETLKLFFNTLNKTGQGKTDFTATEHTLQQILMRSAVSKPPLEQPIAQALNALATIEKGPQEASAEDVTKQDGSTVDLGPSPVEFTERLITILESSVTAYTPIQLETNLISLLTVLRKVYAQADAEQKAQTSASQTTDLSEVQSIAQQVIDLLRSKILPVDSERDKPLGHSSSLASQLLQLQTPSQAQTRGQVPSFTSLTASNGAAGLTHLPNAISALLYDLSNRDPTTFIHNIGYGHAAGYLMTHGIAVPENLRQDMSPDAAAQGIPINPITGQRLDMETPVDMPEMTEEEKEREAERLFVLFERLKATGVVNVENPVTRIPRQEGSSLGKVEEVHDSDGDAD